LVKAFQDKPVKFFGIMAHSSSSEAASYKASNGMTMPVYADNLGLMQKRYGFEISLNNIMRVRLVGPDGNLFDEEMSQAGLDRAIERVKPKWKYRGEKDDAKLLPVLDLLEISQYAPAVKQLTPLRKSTSKTAKESAEKLYETLKPEGEEWKAEAEKVAEEDPVKAYDLYTKIVTVFAGDALAKEMAEPRKKLAANKAVISELAARKAYDPILAGMARLTPEQKKVLAQQLQGIVKKYKDTPTSEKAAALLKEVDK